MLIKRALGCVIPVLSFYCTSAQNLLTNPGAELLPTGTGWTIVAAGADGTCVAGSAAHTYSNWTMTPDGSANYPAAHQGTMTFFAGCNTTVPAGPFELYQVVDVSADAVAIDAGRATYNFSGYIQTPISSQGDNGRFVVDFLNASNVIQGTSYSSIAQSGSGGSGSAWTQYTNMRTAPATTRKIKVRLQTNVVTGPAINAYFDDISLTKTIVLPINLLSFSANMEGSIPQLQWTVSDAQHFSQFAVERSTDGSAYVLAGSIKYVSEQSEYTFRDVSSNSPHLFYRLKMLDVDGKFSYSNIILLDGTNAYPLKLSPNPATGSVMVSGLGSHGTIEILNVNGIRLLQTSVTATEMMLDIRSIPAGIYMVSYNNGSAVEVKKLMIK